MAKRFKERIGWSVEEEKHKFGITGHSNSDKKRTGMILYNGEPEVTGHSIAQCKVNYLDSKKDALQLHTCWSLDLRLSRGFIQISKLLY